MDAASHAEYEATSGETALDEDVDFAVGAGTLRERPTRQGRNANELGAPPAPNDPATSQPEPPAAGQVPLSKPDTEGPLLIYRATLTMAVFETRKVMDAIERMAKEAGGYLVNRNDGQITVRVPARSFDNALDQFAKQGDELRRDVQVSDVTEQYSDLAIRLRNAESMRDRLEALLEKVSNVEEALAVEAQLERVAGTIELIKGKLKRLRELIAFSTITVVFEARPVDKVKSKVELPFLWLKQLGLPELLEL